MWQGKEAKKKYHLVNWATVCKSKKEGGLGLTSIKLMSQALLGKWLWRLGEEQNSLWGQVIYAKYEVSGNGWDLSGLSYRFSTLWKGITSVREAFQANTPCRVGSGDNIYFWLDCWIGDTSLAEQFPDLFSCARDKQAKVSNYMLKVADSIHWSPVFRRNLSQIGESQFFSLLDLLYQSSIVGEGREAKIVESGPLQRMVCFRLLLSFQP